jgi:hypothetical protein
MVAVSIQRENVLNAEASIPHRLQNEGVIRAL